jgi:hypothetical protein
VIRRILERAIIPVLTLTTVAVCAAVAGYATADTRPATISFEAEPKPEAQPEVIRVIVLGLDGDTLRVSEGGNELRLHIGSNTAIEELTPVDLEDASLGDWVNVAAVPHPTSRFLLTGIVLIPQSQLDRQ